MARSRGVAVCAMLCALVVAGTADALPADGFERGGTATQRAIRVNPPRGFIITAGGDILAESAVRRAGEHAAEGTGRRYDFAPLFAPLAPLNNDADLAICHMELPIGRPGQRAGNIGRSPFGGNLLLAPFELAVGVRAGGFTRCSTASNHSYDAGFTGVASTLDALDTAGITHTGTARSSIEATPSVQLVNDVTVGHLSYTRYSNTVGPSQAWQQNDATSVDRVADDVAVLRRAGAEIVIVSVHLSRELLTAPIAADRDFAQRLTAGTKIDVLVHHGPHVVQPVEWLNGTPVYWSLGNMVSGMGVPGTGRYEDQRTLDGVVARVEFAERSDGTWNATAQSVGICTDPVTRIVRPARNALTDPTSGLDSRERVALLACLARTETVVGPTD